MRFDKGPHSVDRRDGDIAATPQTTDELPIIHGAPTKRGLGHVMPGEKPINLRNKVGLDVHGQDYDGTYPIMSIGYIPRDYGGGMWDASHMDQIEIIRENLRNLMKERGLNASQLSIKAGLAPGYVSELLRANTKSRNPRIDHLHKLADALGCPIFVLLLNPADPKLATFALNYVERALLPPDRK